MLAERLGKAWQAHKAQATGDTVMRFTDEGLVLGAGTILAPAGASGRDITIDETEPRLLALLAAAHLRMPSTIALTHLRKAAESWNRGEDALAAMHVTLSRLDRLAHPDADAQRLFLADNLLRAGIGPDAILKGLDLGEAAVETLARYSPDQPRVPAGSGRPSGEWTSGGAGSPTQVTAPTGRPKPIKSTSRNASAARPPRPKTRPPAASPSRQTTTATASAGVGARLDPTPRPSLATATATAAGAAIAVGRPTVGLNLGAMTDRALAAVADYVAGLAVADTAATGISVAALAAGGVVGFGVLFIPGPGPKGEWVHVGGPADISYFRSAYVPGVTFRYTTPDGVRHEYMASPGPGGEYPGPDGQVIGRWVKTGAQIGLVVSTVALLGSDTDDPKLCPAPEEEADKKARGRDYEDFVKAKFNPGNPTPRGFAYDFVDPNTGRDVSIDDCQQKTGALAEYKGPGFAEHLLEDDPPWKGMLAKMISQADR